MLNSSAELVTTSSPAALFAALDAGRAHVFSFPDRKRLSAFPTVHAAGGRRAALVPGPTPLLVAAAWFDHGIAAYDALTGALLWQRKDLNHVQHLVYAGGEPDKPIVAFSREDGMGWALSALTGKSVGSLRAVRQLYSAPALSRFLTVERTLATLRDASSWTALAAPPLFKLPGRSLVLLDAALTGRMVVMSRPAGDQGAGGLEAVSLVGGRLWTFAPAPRCHFSAVAATPSGFSAIELNLDDSTRQLVELTGTGALVQRRPLPPGPAPTLFDEGRFLLTPDGRALDAATLQPVWSFADLPI